MGALLVVAYSPLGEPIPEDQEGLVYADLDLSDILLAKTAAAEAKGTGIRTTIWDKAKIAKAGMRLFLAVNQGGGNPPRFVHMVYKPAKPKAKVAFVGKGLTFDSGGISIKPSARMDEMRYDMCGGAAVLGGVERRLWADLTRSALVLSSQISIASLMASASSSSMPR